MNKLLATDLDGTLFYPKEKKRMIEDSNLKVLRDFADEGNEVVIISGRSLNYCLKVKKRVNRNASETIPKYCRGRKTSKFIL